MSTNSPKLFSFKKTIKYSIIFLFVCILYGHLIERNWIEVTHHKIKAPLKKPLKIMHLTDLHIDEFGVREEKVLSIIDIEKPDLILISGDSILNIKSYIGLKKLLLKLKAPLGVWSVRGNWENKIKNSNEIKLYQETGAGLLVNENKQIFDNVWLIGLDMRNKKPGIKDAQRGVPSNAFKIGLFHAPDFFEKNYKNFDLVLAGHSHGGQIRIPFLIDLVLDLKKGVGGFVEGWFQKENSKMYVSRGVGTSTLPIRFLCRPEVAIIQLEPL